MSVQEHAPARSGVGRSPKQASALLALGIVAAGLIAIAFVGTAIYNYYIPNIAGQQDFSLGLATVAVVGGTAALLSPCAFGLLPAYFAYYLTLRGDAVEGRSARRTLAASVRYGGATGAGILLAGAVLAAVIWSIGAAFAPGLRVVTSDPNAVTRAIRLAAALVLVALGIAHLRGYRFPWSGGPGVTRVLSGRRHRPSLWFFGYGLCYVVVALPCVANLLAAPLLYAVATGGTDAAAGTAFLFLSTMAVGSMAVAVLVGLSKDSVLRRFQVSAPAVHRVAAIVFIVVGVMLLLLSLDLGLFRDLFFHFPIKE